MDGGLVQDLGFLFLSLGLWSLAVHFPCNLVEAVGGYLVYFLDVLQFLPTVIIRGGARYDCLPLHVHFNVLEWHLHDCDWCFVMLMDGECAIHACPDIVKGLE